MNVKLTEYTRLGGCAAKIEPGFLQQIINSLPYEKNNNILVGMETSDDAVVYKINNDIALIQTLDFFPSPVDDPYTFGLIAAANSLSDVYAMGGEPITAMNIVAFPLCKLEVNILKEILHGGSEKLLEAGCAFAGGHSIDDSEPKYGLSVTGIVHPKKILRNFGAHIGDVLLLTKPIGCGVLLTAARGNMFKEGVQAAIKSMISLNKQAAQIIKKYKVNACTDITGFGLLGHLYEMVSASSVNAVLEWEKIKFFPQAIEAAKMGFLSAAVYSNRKYYKFINFNKNVPGEIQDLLFDPQTSGGLLFSVKQNEIKNILKDFDEKNMDISVIGYIKEKGKGEINVI